MNVATQSSKAESTPRLVAVIVSMVFLLTLGGCSSFRSTGEQFDDAVITSKVKAKLTADPDVNPFEIDVDTVDRVVYLSGTVDTWDERMEAEKLARNTGGVTAVVNELNFGDHTVLEELNDARIASKVKIKLAADPDIRPFDIDVDSDLGVVTLRGMVRTSGQKREAEAIATNTIGVKKVLNRITISSRSG